MSYQVPSAYFVEKRMRAVRTQVGRLESRRDTTGAGAVEVGRRERILTAS